MDLREVKKIYMLTKLYKAIRQSFIQRVLRQLQATSLKLHMGSGGVIFPGWFHVDLCESPQIFKHDLTQGIPLPDKSCSCIYSEHFFEHLDLNAGVRLFKECYRVMTEDAVMRIAMPSLSVLIQKYNTEWQDQDWLRWPENIAIKTKAEMINVAFRSWGHKYLYDEEELKRRLQEAGFSRMWPMNWGESSIAELCHRETRCDSTLIIEVGK